MKRKIILFFGILIFTSFTLRGQKEQVLNLPKYYHERLNLGATIGINKADFILQSVKYSSLSDSLKIIDSQKQYGFNIGFISEIRLSEYFTARVLPDFSFASRTLNFYYDGVKEDFVINKDVESTYIDFPIDIKLRSKRLNNFSAYMTGGCKYVIDLAAQKNVTATTKLSDIVIQLHKNDLAYQMGAGLEFFFPYFKFGFEGKLSVGTKNLIIKDGTELSGSIQKLNAKMFLISFTFEG